MDVCDFATEAEGRETGMCGSSIRCEMVWAAVVLAEADGGRWRDFLSGREERRSEEVGMESGVGSDILLGG